VPSPVLKACLDEMALDNHYGDPFADSDDEDAPTKANMSKTASASGHPLDGSLSTKAGKTPNATLYYVDHKKQKNNGNGLEPQVRNELASALAQAQAEETALKESLKQTTIEIDKLLSEPTNEEAVALLEAEEAELKNVHAKAEEARKHKVNEKTKQRLKRSIESMAAQWRKRRRICMEFLVAMEENTEGSISVKKCLAGDGPIDIDSDDAVAKAAVAFATKKRRKPVGTSKGRPPIGGAKASVASSQEPETLASENFVAVKLDSQGFVIRVLADDSAEEE